MASAEYEMRRIVDRQGWKLTELERKLERQDADQEDIRRDVVELKDTVQKDHEAFIKYVSVAEGAARAAEKAANNSVSAKQLYIGFASASAGIIGALSALAALLH